MISNIYDIDANQTPAIECPYCELARAEFNVPFEQLQSATVVVLCSDKASCGLPFVVECAKASEEGRVGESGEIIKRMRLVMVRCRKIEGYEPQLVSGGL